MREIKFRVWDIKKKIMYYFGDKECPDFMSLNGKIVYSDDNHRPDFCESERYILLQYIGPLDKNEKEIYEGDIIKRDDIERDLTISEGEKCRCEVIFKDGMFTVKDSGGDNLYDVLRASDKLEGEVIGNIYENKDLLK